MRGMHRVSFNALYVTEYLIRCYWNKMRGMHRVSFNALYVTEYLIRCYWNKMLIIKGCFTYMKKEKNGREDFEEFNFEVESER